MWMDLVLILVAVLPLFAEGKSRPRSSESVAFRLADQTPKFSLVRLEAAPTGRPRQ